MRRKFQKGGTAEVVRAGKATLRWLDRVGGHQAGTAGG